MTTNPERPDVPPLSAPPPPPAPPSTIPMRMGVVPLLAAAWALIAIGGAACGLVFGVFFPDVVTVTTRIGLFLGAVIGLPVGIVLTVVIRRPRDRVAVAVLGRGLEAIGAALALAFTSPWVVYLALNGSRLLDPPARRVIELGPLGRGIVALVATVLIGRLTGFCLARLMYRGYGLADRPRCALLFWSRHDPFGPGLTRRIFGSSRGTAAGGRGRSARA